MLKYKWKYSHILITPHYFYSFIILVFYTYPFNSFQKLSLYIVWSETTVYFPPKAFCFPNPYLLNNSSCLYHQHVPNSFIDINSFVNLFSILVIHLSIIWPYRILLLKLYGALTSYKQENPRVMVKIVISRDRPSMTPNSGENRNRIYSQCCLWSLHSYINIVPLSVYCSWLWFRIDFQFDFLSGRCVFIFKQNY